MADKLGIGIIGAGSIAGAAHIPAYQALPETCRLVAVADIDLARAQKLSKESKIPKAFDDYRRLLELDDVHAVSVCTPPAVHAEATLAALAAGKHVICEKPMALNARQARAMVKAAKKARRVLAIDFQTRFAPDARFLKQLITEGELGDIYFARAVYNRRRGIPAWGVFHSKQHSGGGALMDIGVHFLDLALWLMGHPKPVSVLGATYNKFGNREDVYNRWGKWNTKEFDVDDFAVATIKLQNDATLTIECSWALNIEKDQQALQLCGDRGGADLYPLKIYKDRGIGLVDWIPQGIQESKSNHALCIADFVKAIREERPPLVRGEHGLLVAELIDAVYESARTGELVSLK